MVLRDGDVRFRVMERLISDRLTEVIAENADLMYRVITDNYASAATGRQDGCSRGGHEVVQHENREYGRVGTDVHRNTIEGVFSPGEARRDGHAPQRQQATLAELPERV
jgi:hypothetical protein